MMNINTLNTTNEHIERLRLVVRLTTETYFGNNDSIIFKKVLKVLKRKSKLCLDDLCPEGIETFEYSPIINLQTVEDGVYEIIPINVRIYTDGFPEEWDYQLIPYKE